MAVAASATIAKAQTIDLSLNLRYTDPFDPSEGGRWYLTGKTSGGATNLGIASVSAWLTGINDTIFHGSAVAAGGGYPADATQATLKNIGDADNGNSPFGGVFGTATNVLYGQDLTTVAGIAGGVGLGAAGSPGLVATDPLRNAAFNNYAVLLSGTFGATRPAFAPTTPDTTTGGSVLTSTTVANTPSIAATIAAANLKVRGDSEVSKGLNTPATAGLFQGDANRDGSVTGADFNILAFNFGDTPPAGGFGWDQGDFNDDGTVTGADFNALAFRFGDPSPPAPALAGVPEPASVSLIAMGAFGILGAVRRRR
jgi:hypothetical protein